MYNKSDFILLLAESFKRWGQKSPKFFRVWKTVNFLISAIAALSAVIASAVANSKWAPIILGAVSFCTAYGGAMNTLTVSVPAPEVMPFTEKKNMQKIEKAEALKIVA